MDPAYTKPRWIPLTADGSGGHIGLDLDPWPGGRVGQIILFGRDEDVKIVLAESLAQFFGVDRNAAGERQFQTGNRRRRGSLAAVQIEAPANK